MILEEIFRSPCCIVILVVTVPNLYVELGDSSFTELYMLNECPCGLFYMQVLEVQPVFTLPTEFILFFNVNLNVNTHILHTMYKHELEYMY